MNRIKNEKIKSKLSKKEGKSQKAYFINYEIIKWGREHAKLTLREASQQLDIPTELLIQIEKGNVDLTLDDLRLIAKTYGINKNVFWLDNIPTNRIINQRVDNYEFTIYPNSKKVEFEEYDEQYESHLKNKILIPLDQFDKIIELYEDWKYCDCGDEIKPLGADKCAVCRFMDKLNKNKENEE